MTKRTIIHPYDPNTLPRCRVTIANRNVDRRKERVSVARGLRVLTQVTICNGCEHETHRHIDNLLREEPRLLVKKLVKHEKFRRCSTRWQFVLTNHTTTAWVPDLSRRDNCISVLSPKMIVHSDNTLLSQLKSPNLLFVKEAHVRVLKMLSEQWF